MRYIVPMMRKMLVPTMMPSVMAVLMPVAVAPVLVPTSHQRCCGSSCGAADGCWKDGDKDTKA